MESAVDVVVIGGGLAGVTGLRAGRDIEALLP
jgi:anaerobic glycerol-3-phosphate dehydrogenase